MTDKERTEQLAQLLSECLANLKGDSSIDACAEKLRLSPSTVGRVLAGHGTPSLVVVDIILRASGLDIVEAISE